MYILLQSSSLITNHVPNPLIMLPTLSLNNKEYVNGCFCTFIKKASNGSVVLGNNKKLVINKY